VSNVRGVLVCPYNGGDGDTYEALGRTHRDDDNQDTYEALGRSYCRASLRSSLPSVAAVLVPGDVPARSLRSLRGLRLSSFGLRPHRRPGNDERPRPSSPPERWSWHGAAPLPFPASRGLACARHALPAGERLPGRSVPESGSARAPARGSREALAAERLEHPGARAGRFGATSTPREPPGASLDPKPSPWRNRRASALDPVRRRKHRSDHRERGAKRVATGREREGFVNSVPATLYNRRED